MFKIFNLSCPRILLLIGVFFFARVMENPLIGQNSVNVKAFGAKGNGTADDTRAIQKAINSRANVVVFPKGIYLISKCILRSNIKLTGQKGAIIKCLDIKSNSPQNGTFEILASKGMQIDKITFSNLTFISNPPYTSNKYPVCIYFFASGDSKFTNLVFDNVKFNNVSNNAILLLANQSTVGFSNVIVSKCSAYGSENHRKYIVGNLIRIMNNSDPRTNYGVVIAENIRIRNSFATNIRTLADIKRGCNNVVIENNVTRNMHDCHFSIDGSFNCKVIGNTSSTDEDFLMGKSLTGSNFLEVQGEHVDIRKNKCTNFKNQGIFITDYSYPEEKEVGHVSKFINIENNQITGIKNTGIKILNAEDVNITGNVIRNCGVWDVSIDSRTGRHSISQRKLEANRIVISNNKISGKGIADNVNKVVHKSNNSIINIKQKNE